MVSRLVQWLRTDLQNLQRVVRCCADRVMHERKVPAHEKVLRGEAETLLSADF